MRQGSEGQEAGFVEKYREYPVSPGSRMELKNLLMEEERFEGIPYRCMAQKPKRQLARKGQSCGMT